MRCAVLDLGSNSFHLLVADVVGTSIVPVRREREMLHLGRAIAQHGAVPMELRARARATVERLSHIAHRIGVEKVVAVGTEALRSGAADDLVPELAEAAGLEIELLDGLEEGRLAHLGARASIGVDVDEDPTLVLDLGGGSLELVIGHQDRALWAASLPLGASALSATLPDRSDDRQADRRRLTAHIDELLRPALEVAMQHRPRTIIAVGGTVRALARLLSAREDRWLPSTVNQAPLPREGLRRLTDELLALDTAGRSALDGVKSRRADHLHVGALVLSQTLDGLDGPAARVSDWGLREGVLLHRFGRAGIPSSSELRTAEVTRIRNLFGKDDPHPEHVAMNAMRLFDATTDLHRLAEPARWLLESAARLHAIGTALALRRQQEHGAYLLQHAELRGFTPAELAMLSTLVRFHPSRAASRRFPPFASLDTDDRVTVESLLGLLQIADALDAAHDQQAHLRTVRRVRGDLELVLEEPPGPLTIAAVRDRSRALSAFSGMDVVLRAPRRS
jgi:exopolyphosphatase / guanosine-5'-triphosphate,3'-diphosphate pyrophosphatase